MRETRQESANSAPPIRRIAKWTQQQRDVVMLIRGADHELDADVLVERLALELTEIRAGLEAQAIFAWGERHRRSHQISCATIRVRDGFAECRVGAEQDDAD